MQESIEFFEVVCHSDEVFPIAPDHALGTHVIEQRDEWRPESVDVVKNNRLAVTSRLREIILIDSLR